MKSRALKIRIGEGGAEHALPVQDAANGTQTKGFSGEDSIVVIVLTTSVIFVR